MTDALSGATGYRIVETGQRVNAVEFELHFQFGLWTVTEQDGDRWVVRTRDGERLTLRPLSATTSLPFR